MKRKDIIEFEIGSMEFGGESSTLIGKRKVKMKGGITGQKVKAMSSTFAQKLNYYDEISKYIKDKNKTTLNLINGAYLETEKSDAEKNSKIKELLNKMNGSDSKEKESTKEDKENKEDNEEQVNSDNSEEKVNSNKTVNQNKNKSTNQSKTAKKTTTTQNTNKTKKTS